LKVYFSRAEDEINDEEIERILTAEDDLTEESENRDDRNLIPPGEDFAVVIPHHNYLGRRGRLVPKRGGM
jgi:hypothetical protein